MIGLFEFELALSDILLTAGNDQLWFKSNQIISILEAATRASVLRNVVLRNLAKFTGKHLCHLFFNKVTGLKDLLHTTIFSKYTELFN